MEDQIIVEQVPAASWEQWAAQRDAVILDVREPIEWALGTLPGARLMAMSTIADEWQDLDPARPHLVVCRSGNRSDTVAKALQAAGFEQVANLAGGMVALGLA
ncbi:MAG TPA: rhodanese-like domain-containing protein [Acidimicrobiia bacterium]